MDSTFHPHIQYLNIDTNPDIVHSANGHSASGLFLRVKPDGFASSDELL